MDWLIFGLAWAGIALCVWCLVSVPVAFLLAAIMAPRDDD